MSIVTVDTKQRSYEVHIGTGLLDRVGEQTAQVIAPCKVALVTDSNVAPLYGEQVAASLRRAGFAPQTFVIQSGESSKNTQTLLRLIDFLATHGFTRTDLIVALGGGVVGDLSGFAAAIYLRGIAFVQMPTTLLAAVDASVGGKTAVDLPAGKNLMGAFWQPSAVFCDCDTFASLSRSEIANGMAEVVKYGMLRDEQLLADIGEQGIDMDMPSCVTRCVRIKSDIVAADELDKGERQLLNFGHTVGHAIEKLSGLAVSHGHGVAIGMAVMAKASEACGLTEQPCYEPLLKILRRCELPAISPFGAAALAQAASVDKKRAGDSLTLVIPTRMGACRLHRMPLSELTDFLAKGL